jgi:YfiH family protein
MVTVRTADCVPVLLHDPGRRVVAAIHAGWRGAVAGIVPKTVALLVDRFGATVEGLRMAIGPSAGPCCYEVDEPVLSKLREVFSDWQAVVRPVAANKAHLDLRAFVRRQALADGLSAGAGVVRRGQGVNVGGGKARHFVPDECQYVVRAQVAHVPAVAAQVNVGVEKSRR